jgi:hypothetical protein
MERKDMYYSLREAEEIKQTFSSWIGKKAYTVCGKQEVLKNIIIKPVHLAANRLKVNFSIDFEFENRNVCASTEFLSVNGLMR